MRRVICMVDERMQDMYDAKKDPLTHMAYDEDDEG